MSSNGRSPGFTAQLDRYPDDDVTVVILSNSYATTSQDPIAGDIAAIVLGDARSPAPEMRGIEMPMTRLTPLAGRYQYGPDYFVPNAQFEVSVGPGYLLLQLGGFRTPLVPLSGAEFLERNFLGRVVFSRSEEGKADRLTYRYAGREFAARRISDK